MNKYEAFIDNKVQHLLEGVEHDLDHDTALQLAQIAVIGFLFSLTLREDARSSGAIGKEGQVKTTVTFV